MAKPNIQERPTCEDFVIQTIRTIRIRRTNQTPGTASGVELHKVWKIVSNFYTETEFRAAVKHMLKAQILVGWYSSYQNGRTLKIKMEHIPTNWDIKKGQRRSYIYNNSEWVHTAQLHITEDGLSPSICTLITGHNPTASRIMQQLQGDK
jgi:hypothetical protein